MRQRDLLLVRLKSGKCIGQRDLPLVLAQIQSVSTWCKETTSGAGSNTVCTLGKETYYWCWLKYGQYISKRDLLPVQAPIRYVHKEKRPTTGAG